MAGDLVGVVLAAGLGTRLRPLTELRPKVLCPVNNVPLLDLNLATVHPLVVRTAVNVHHLRPQVIDHLAGTDVHVSEEIEEALGTAGALGRLRGWIAGHDVLVVNGDGWRPGSLDPLIEGWSGDRIRLLVVGDPERADFGRWRFAGASLMPWADVDALAPEPAGLYEVSWREALDAGRVDLVEWSGPFVDCGTPADYLAANLTASGGTNVIGEGAIVDGRVERCVVWPGAKVATGEELVDAIRAGTPDSPVTVQC